MPRPPKHGRVGGLNLIRAAIAKTDPNHLRRAKHKASLVEIGIL
jgi:hypothetical protein